MQALFNAGYNKKAGVLLDAHPRNFLQSNRIDLLAHERAGVVFIRNSAVGPKVGKQQRASSAMMWATLFLMGQVGAEDSISCLQSSKARQVWSKLCVCAFFFFFNQPLVH